MNCHRARQLISPYLDHQLTGQQMLTLQQHCAECASCEAEMRSLRQLKSLMRSLHDPRPRADLPQTIALRLTEADAPVALWKSLLPADLSPLPATPQRGRRLMTALAFSCLTVFAVAAPFAPDGIIASEIGLRPQARPTAQPAMRQLTAMPPADVRPSGLLVLTDTDQAQQERQFAAPYVQPAQPESMAAPLADETVPAYVQGDVAFAGYRTR